MFNALINKTEWRLISATLCGWRRCFVADELWFTTHTRRRRRLIITKFNLTKQQNVLNWNNWLMATKKTTIHELHKLLFTMMSVTMASIVQCCWIFTKQQRLKINRTNTQLNTRLRIVQCLTARWQSLLPGLCCKYATTLLKATGSSSRSLRDDYTNVT